MSSKILLFETEEEAFAKSAEYHNAPPGSVTKYRWSVEKHPTLEQWAVLIGENISELSEADQALVQDMWELPNNGVYD